MKPNVASDVSRRHDLMSSSSTFGMSMHDHEPDQGQ